MRQADLSPGMRVAVSPNLKTKHLSTLPPEMPDDMAGAFVGAMREHFVTGLLREWNAHARRGEGFHVGQVAEVGAWWGGRRAGVLLHVPVPERLRERFDELLPGVSPVAEVIVPSSMLGDLDEHILERAELLLWAERRGGELRAKMAAIRARRETS